MSRADDMRGTEQRVETGRAQEATNAFFDPDYQVLPAPPESDEDVVYRWIRVNIGSDDDHQNVANSLNRGYEPVREGEIPNFHAPSIKHGAFTGVIGVQGMILCKVPRAYAEQRKRMVAAQADRLEQAVRNNWMRVQDSRMPITETNRETVRKGVRSFKPSEETAED